MSDPKKAVTFTFRVSDELAAAIRKQAESEGRTVSNYITQLIRRNLEVQS